MKFYGNLCIRIPIMKSMTDYHPLDIRPRTPEIEQKEEDDTDEEWTFVENYE